MDLYSASPGHYRLRQGTSQATRRRLSRQIIHVAIWFQLAKARLTSFNLLIRNDCELDPKVFIEPSCVGRKAAVKCYPDTHDSRRPVQSVRSWPCDG